MQLKDKIIILTGGARIGKVVARELSLCGAHLALSYLSHKTEADIMCKECEEMGSKTVAFQADLSKTDEIKKFVGAVKAVFGRIDALVHMAAIYPRTPWDKLTEADWDKNMNVIAKSTYTLGKLAADEMLKNEGDPVMQDGVEVGHVKGKIVTIADWSVLTRPYKDYLPYNAAKSAVIGLTKSFAKELAPHILVNSVAPGPILRPPDLSDEDNAEVIAGTPLARWGGAGEIAKVVLYLMDTDFVTGQVIVVDGGRTIA